MPDVGQYSDSTSARKREQSGTWQHVADVARQIVQDATRKAAQTDGGPT
jgi:hypothetical protein